MDAWAVLWALVGVIAALAIAVLTIRAMNRRRRAKSREREQEPRPFPQNEERPSRGVNPETLGYKDTVVIGGVVYAVSGVIICNEDGFRWKEFWLDGSGSKTWLSVERDTALEVIQWTEIKTDLQPGDKKLTYNGVDYVLDEDGKADYTALGTTGLPGNGTVRYYDYRSSDDARLSFERFNKGEWEASEGFVLPEGMYELYRAPRA